MRRKHVLITSLSAIYFFSIFFISSANYKVELNLPFYKNDTVKLGYYYGDKVIHMFNLTLDSKGTSSYSKIVREGIYTILLPDSNSYEFMITDKGTYALESVGNNIRLLANQSSMAFDTLYILTQKTERYIFSQKLTMDKLDAQEKYAQKIKIKKARRNLERIRLEMEQRYSKTFLGNYLKAMTPVKIPEFRISPHSKNPDSVYWSKSMAHYRKHFLDNISWNDTRLIYSPVIELTLLKYLQRIVSQEPHSLASAIDQNLENIQNVEMRVFVINLLLLHYQANKHQTLSEYVYLHLIENYILIEEHYVSDTLLIQRSQEELIKLRPMTIGSIAPSWKLPDKDHANQSFKALNGGLNIIIFWDYSCPRCKYIIDEFTVLLENYKYENIRTYSIYVGEDLEIWQAWANKRLIQEWTNTYQHNNMDVASVYKVTRTPAIFLMDKAGVILDKYLTIKELDAYLKKYKNDSASDL